MVSAQPTNSRASSNNTEINFFFMWDSFLERKSEDPLSVGRSCAKRIFLLIED
jgi:hypothetical protein